MYLFGGNMANGEANEKLYALNMNSLTWEIIKVNSENGVFTRDEHTANIHTDDKMYVFGGFEKGIRMNSVAIFNF